MVQDKARPQYGGSAPAMAGALETACCGADGERGSVGMAGRTLLGRRRPGS